jgi:hypothetical protein
LQRVYRGEYYIPISENEVGTHCTASAAPNWRYEV